MFILNGKDLSNNHDWDVVSFGLSIFCINYDANYLNIWKCLPYIFCIIMLQSVPSVVCVRALLLYPLCSFTKIVISCDDQSHVLISHKTLVSNEMLFLEFLKSFWSGCLQKSITFSSLSFNSHHSFYNHRHELMILSSFYPQSHNTCIIPDST